ncbi:hypothetical protein EHM76_04425 [bacterium]|nr:MAG: hypothetical protein EHM76_04425 [bacterium]
MTVQEFDALCRKDSFKAGAMWPKCKACGHIVQEHDNRGCGARMTGQCPECSTHVNNARCRCKAYDGPQTIEEMLEMHNAQVSEVR